MSTHHKDNNARLKPDVLAQLAEQAQAENKTVDDLLDEAARGLLETRRDIDGLRSFAAENGAEMKKRGFTERDVIPAIKEYRKEKRER
jgi:predicted alpha-1,6-mannanase (GH76 family)